MGKKNALKHILEFTGIIAILQTKLECVMLRMGKKINSL